MGVVRNFCKARRQILAELAANGGHFGFDAGATVNHIDDVFEVVARQQITLSACRKCFQLCRKKSWCGN